MYTSSFPPGAPAPFKKTTGPEWSVHVQQTTSQITSQTDTDADTHLNSD